MEVQLRAALAAVIATGTLHESTAIPKAVNEFVETLPESSGKNADVVSVMFRKLITETIVTTGVGCTDEARKQLLFQGLEALLDLALECSEKHKDFVEAVLPLLLLEDTLDMVIAADAPRIFDYIESRNERLIAGLEPGKGKGLVVLRMCNELLRRLSKTKNTAFCGRILIFLTNAYPLTERSGVNLKGEFNIENITYFVPEEQNMDRMEVDAGAPKSAADSFYNQFWGLQRYFSNPLSIFEGSNWTELTKGVESVLKEFNSVNEAVLGESSSSDKKRKDRNDKPEQPKPVYSFETPSTEDFFPKYLTSRNLFELQLTDQNFRFLNSLIIELTRPRRQILVQMLIIFQLLLILAKHNRNEEAKAAASTEDKTAAKTGDKTSSDSKSKDAKAKTAVGDAKEVEKATAVAPVKEEPKPLANKTLQAIYAHPLTIEQEDWVISMRTKAMRTLEAIPPNGKRFSNTLTTVITHEKNWIKWKEDSCPSFEKPPTVFETKRRKLEVSAATNPNNVGTEALSRLFLLSRDPNETIQDSKRGDAVQSLASFLEPLAEQLNPDGTVAEGIEEQYLWSKNKGFNWRAYRLAMKSHFHLFRKMDGIDSALLWKLSQPAKAATAAVPPESRMQVEEPEPAPVPPAPTASPAAAEPMVE